MKKAYRFGIEIECNVPTGNYTEFKRQVQAIGCETAGDGSIHADSDQEGIEIKTPPMGFNRLARTLTKIEKLCETNNVEVNRSCGLHVHVSNKRFYIVKNLRRIALLWVAIEDVLFATQPESRLNNQYCQRKLKHYITNGLPTLPHDKDSLVRELGSTDRYYALNFASLARHGTIECRLHAGTTSAKKIIYWAKLLQSIYTYALERYDEKAVSALFEKKTDENKIKKTWDILTLDTAHKTYLNARIQKFMLPKLGAQQEAAVKAMKLQPTKQSVTKRYQNIREELDSIRHEEEILLRAFA
ncbi:MAG: amidoligase family protein [Candidatus Yonathbacteria bacterium]|nr:amidoligase family protein [Candidatus Yonathbacteria bacterium]